MMKFDLVHHVLWERLLVQKLGNEAWQYTIGSSQLRPGRSSYAKSKETVHTIFLVFMRTGQKAFALAP